MPTKLITGKPGQGKSHYAMKLIQKAINDGRTVYTNIDGITLDVYPIPKNDNGEADWTLVPPADKENGHSGALIVYDEAQRLVDNRDFRYFAYKPKEKLSDRKVISELEYHRHLGHDIIFITQSPNLLHLHLLELVNEHYHCVRPMNKQGSQIALWRSWQRSPDTQSALDRAEDVIFEPFDKKIFDLYKSTDEVTDSKIRIPKYIKKLAFIAIFCGISILALFFFVDNPMFNFSQNAKALSGDKEALEGMNKYLPPSVVEANKTLKDSKEKLSTGVQLDTRTPEQREQERRDHFNNVISNNQQQLMQYNVNKPYEIDQASYQYKIQESPYLSGCVIFNSKCSCYTQQATLIDISVKDCKRFMNGDRPFNPFKQVSHQNVTSNNSGNSPLPSQQNTPQISVDEYAKYQEYQRITQEYQRSQPQQAGELNHGFG